MDFSKFLKQMRNSYDYSGQIAHIEVIPDRKQAIRAALSAARKGDAVVVAGKGHETTQELPTGTVPFDDRQVIREILRAIGYGEPTHGAA